MQHALKHVERPGGSHTVLDGKKNEIFRTDAKCENNMVVLAGYHFPDGRGRWFSMRVAPYASSCSKRMETVSAPAELLAVLVALRLFGYLESKTGRTCIRLWNQSGKDNRSIDFLSKKNSPARWPLTLVNAAFTLLDEVRC